MRGKDKGKSIAPWDHYYRGDLPLEKVAKRHKKDANRRKRHLDKQLDNKGDNYNGQ